MTAVTAQDEHGSTPLYQASFSGSVNPTRSSSSTADATAQDKGGLTPLDYVSASSRGTVDLARFLLEHGAEATALSTPPHQASSGRNVDLARFLIEHGAFATAEDEDGSTPLH